MSSREVIRTTYSVPFPKSHDPSVLEFLRFEKRRRLLEHISHVRSCLEVDLGDYAEIKTTHRETSYQASDFPFFEWITFLEAASDEA